MDRELKILKVTYVVVATFFTVAFFTVAMLIGGAYIHSIPESFFM